MSVTGVQLAIGFQYEGLDGGVEQDQQETAAGVALSAAGFGIVASFLLRPRYLHGLTAAVGVASLVILKLKVDRDLAREAEGLISATYEPGYWLALFLLAAAGTVGFLFASRRPTEAKPKEIRDTSPAVRNVRAASARDKAQVAQPSSAPEPTQPATGTDRRGIWIVSAAILIAGLLIAGAILFANRSESPDNPNVARTVPPSLSPDVLPQPVQAVTQGGEYWGVYLAVGDPGSAVLSQASVRLHQLGISAYEGDLSCDSGAASQLRVPRRLSAVALYFYSESDAREFADAMVPPPVGLARVRTYCAD